MQSMTYGVMPTKEQFEVAFEFECPYGVYKLHLGASDSAAVENFKLGDGAWTIEQLWEALTEIIQYQPGAEEAAKYQHAMDQVSVILETLGFEWI